jgi:hypothetical protein
MPKIGLVESCEKKVCLDVLHIELVIMYKFFMSLRIHCFIINFFVTCCGEMITVCVLTLVMYVVNGPHVVCRHVAATHVSVACYHVCCAAHVCACWVARTVSKFFTDVDLLMLCVCVDQLITNNFYFFF